MEKRKLVNSLALMTILCLACGFVLAAMPTLPPNPPSESFLPSSNVEQLLVTPSLPAQNAARQPSTVQFIVSLTNSSRMANCKLYINDSLQDTTTTIGSSATLTKTFVSSQVGLYSWFINCTDINGLSGVSTKRTLNISSSAAIYQPVTLILDDEEYYPGDAVTLDGEDFSSLATNIKLWMKKGSITLKTETLATSSSGKFTKEYILALNSVDGNYSFYVENQNNKTQNGTAHFAVVLPDTELSVSKKRSLPPDRVKITGEKFLVKEKVNVSFYDVSKLIHSKLFETSSSGKFTYYYDVLENATAANLSIIATQVNNSLIKANTTLEILYIPVLNTTNVTNVTEYTYYRDADGDGYGNPLSTRNWTSLPTGYVPNDDDCDDSNANIKPLTQEECNGADDNCDGTIDNGAICGSGLECQAGVCVTATVPPPEATCYDGILNQDETNVDCGGLCASSRGSHWYDGSCHVDPEVTIPVFTEEPAPEKSSLWWFLIPLILIVVVGGGFLGFVGYEGNLDMSSMSGFIDGCKESLGMGSSSSRLSSMSFDKPLSLGDTVKTPEGLGAAGPSGFSSSGAASQAIPQQDIKMLSSFINGERSKGYDDLTIRNALLQKGWKEPEVDGVFDTLYT